MNPDNQPFQETQHPIIDQPQSNEQPQQYQTPVQKDPGLIFGIISLAMVFIFPPIGLIIAIIGLLKSKKLGLKNVVAWVGLIMNIFCTLIIVLVLGAITINVSNMQNTRRQKCEEIVDGIYTFDYGVLTCSSGEVQHIEYN